MAQRWHPSKLSLHNCHQEKHHRMGVELQSVEYQQVTTNELKLHTSTCTESGNCDEVFVNILPRFWLHHAQRASCQHKTFFDDSGNIQYTSLGKPAAFECTRNLRRPGHKARQTSCIWMHEKARAQGFCGLLVRHYTVTYTKQSMLTSNPAKLIQNVFDAIEHWATPFWLQHLAISDFGVESTKVLKRYSTLSILGQEVIWFVRWPVTWLNHSFQL